MKQKDFALIAVVVFISAVFSVFISKVIFVTPQNREQKVEVVEPISSDFTMPDTHYFNSNSIDPTKLITIGNNANPVPFKSASQ